MNLLFHRRFSAFILSEGCIHTCFNERSVVLVFERYKPSDKEGYNSSNKNEDKEVLISADVFEYPSAQHARKHHAEIHDAGCESIVGHLVFAGCHLLHHEQCEAYEAEAIAEIFKTDAACYEDAVGGLEYGEKCVDYKGRLKIRAREKRVLRSPRAEM